jgi:hypothetical protein
VLNFRACDIGVFGALGTEIFPPGQDPAGWVGDAAARLGGRRDRRRYPQLTAALDAVHSPQVDRGQYAITRGLYGAVGAML